MRLLAATITIAVSLSACSGGEYVAPRALSSTATSSPNSAASTPASTTPPVGPGTTAAPPVTAAPTSAPTFGSTATPTPAATLAPGATATPTPAVTPVPTPTPTPIDSYLNVSNLGNASFTVYPPRPSGDVTPIATDPPNLTCSGCSAIYINPTTQNPYNVMPDDVTISDENGTFTSPAIKGVGVLTADASDRVYVGDPTTGSITVYAAGATGSVMPLETINGSNTELGNISGLGVDSKGTIYAITLGGSAIHEFVTGNQNGNVTPLDVSGSNTQLDYTAGLAIDSDDEIAVTTQGNGSLLLFHAQASGNVAPMVQATAQLSNANFGVCFDPVYDAVYVVKTDGSVATFSQNGTLLAYLNGTDTALNRPRSCAASTSLYTEGYLFGDARARKPQRRPAWLDLTYGRR